jgi:flagellar M-ring protein FliF
MTSRLNNRTAAWDSTRGRCCCWWASRRRSPPASPSCCGGRAELEPAVRQPRGESDASQVVQALQTAGIKYKLSDDTGAIMVPAEKVHEARLQAGGAGPAGRQQQRPRPDQQGLRHRRQPVHGERALPVRARDRAGAHHLRCAASRRRASTWRSAAVGIRARPASGQRLGAAAAAARARRLESEQVQAIIHLVASSIPELDSPTR